MIVPPLLAPAVDVESQNEDGCGTAGGTELVDALEVDTSILAPGGHQFTTRCKRDQFGTSLHQSQAEEEKECKGCQPQSLLGSDNGVSRFRLSGIVNQKPVAPRSLGKLARVDGSPPQPLRE